MKTQGSQVSLTTYTDDNNFILTAHSIEIGGRATFSITGQLGETGFCYSESKPEPTVSDNKVIDEKPFVLSDGVSLKYS